MAMLDFICMGSAELLGTGMERKIQRFQQDWNPRPTAFEIKSSALYRSAIRFRCLNVLYDLE